MLWKKGFFSNLIWFLMTVILFCGLLIFTDHIIDSYFVMQPGMEYLICSGILILVCLLVLLFRRFVVILDLDNYISRSNSVIAESIIILLILVGGTAVRVLNCLRLNSEYNQYYIKAILTNAGDGITCVNGLVDVYHSWLRLICYFFGNRLEVCVFAQLILGVIAGVVIALAVRKLAGGIAMVLVSALYGFSPYMIEVSTVLSPVVLYLIIYFMAILLIGVAIQRGYKAWGFAVLAGLITAVAIYLDVTGVTLLLIALSALYLDREESKPVLKGLFGCLEIWGFTLILLAGIFLIDSYISNVDYIYSARFWIGAYRPGNLFLPVIGVNFALGDVEQIILIFVILAAIIGIYTYWISHSFEKSSVWAMLFMALSAIYCLNISGEHFRGVPLIYLMFAVWAALGIGGFVKYRNAVTAEEEPMIPEEKGLISETDSDGESKTDGESVSAEESVTPKFVPIPNPLPLPKKHKKKVHDFDRQIPEEDDFDIDVSENDDFDM